ncbi:ATP-binding protein [Actinoplanes sp. NPDC051346]|uniref:sensor histidine kinase n=1 Tax=Actinoplanes sp. NPDC051346 TaxID=3155048 RepID=UPI00343BE910
MGSDQTLRAVLDSLETVVLGCDAQGWPVLCNQAARDLFGPLIDAVPVPSWLEHLTVTDEHGRRLSAEDSLMARVMAGDKLAATEVVFTPPDGGWRSFRVHGSAVTDGGPVAAVIALHETTAQRRAELLKDCELQVSELLSQSEPSDTMLANAVDLIGDRLDWAATEFWAVDPVGQVLRRGPCWAAQGHRLPCELPAHLVEGEGVAGRAWRASNPRWSADLHADADAARQRSDWGTLRGAIAVPIPSGSVTLGVLVCYSDHRETPDDTRTAVMTGIAAHLGEFLERRRAEQFAAELDQTRNEYIALVGHELRTPLTSIQSYTDTLRSEPDMPADERAQMLDVMNRNTVRVHALIAKLLDVAGTRSGHLTLQPAPLDLAALAHTAADDAAADSTVAVAVNAPPQVTIEADPHRLRAVIDELLTNAITWAPPDSTVGVTVHADDHTAVFAISNTGPRIPADERERVFDLFMRTGAAHHRGVPGTGLGLTFARAVVEQHGGTITVSEPDEAATTFTVRLPIHQRTHAAAV